MRKIVKKIQRLTHHSQSNRIFSHIRCGVFLIFFLGISINVAAQDIRIRAPQGKGDTVHEYFLKLLELALTNTQDEYGQLSITITKYNVTQIRSLQMIEQNKGLDLNWAGTNTERERQLLAIRIPLNLGLLGYRLLSIRKDRKSDFDRIKSVDELKRLRACQGSHWPDSDVLEAAGFNVLRTVKFEAMYRMVKAGRCDFFPRSIIEGYGEVRHPGREELLAYDRILVAYKFPMYFFVNKTKSQLAKRIGQGLIKALDEGSFMGLMRTQSTTKSAFPLSQYRSSIVFHIENPFLPPETPINISKLWLKMPSSRK
jgi:hypothetical protein